MDTRQARIAFSQLEWESPMPGMRVKKFQQDGRTIRLVEFREEFTEPDFCTKAHAGYVLEGSLALHFPDGSAVRLERGDGLFLPGTPENRHMAKVDPGHRALLLLMET
jgi:hypothetical protein